MTASAWFDKWHEHGPLISHVTYRAISNAGFTSNEKVSDIITAGGWNWPQQWYTNYPSLSIFQVPILAGNEDRLTWRSHDGMIHDFTVTTAWNSVRTRAMELDWHSLVWSKYIVPKHAIHLWLVMRQRLKTQDRLRHWDVGRDIDLSSLTCFLCKQQKETHCHLFFECNYSAKVWKKVLEIAKLTCNSTQWDQIMSWIVPILKQNKVDVIVGRLLIAATSYVIWQERNRRLHGKDTRTEDIVVKIITDGVRLKLASIQFKKKQRVRRLKEIWKIPWKEDIVDTVATLL